MSDWQDKWQDAEKAVQAGDFTRAINLYHELIEENPTGEFWAKLAFCYNEMSKAKEAIEASQKALELDEKNWLAWSQLGWAHKTTKNYSEAISAFTRLIELEADSWAYSQLSFCHNEESNWDEALKTAKNAVELDETNIFGWCQLGWGHKNKKEYKDAISHYENALELNPDNDWILAECSFCLNELDNHLQALNYAVRSIESNPANTFAMGQRLYALNQLERYKEVIAYASEFVVRNPTEMVWRQKGWAEKQLKDYKVASFSFKQATEMAPDDSWNWTQFAECSNRIGRIEEAEKAAQRALELSPSSSIAQQELRVALSSKTPRLISFDGI